MTLHPLLQVKLLHAFSVYPLSIQNTKIPYPPHRHLEVLSGDDSGVYS